MVGEEGLAFNSANNGLSRKCGAEAPLIHKEKALALPDTLAHSVRPRGPTAHPTGAPMGGAA